MRTIPFQLDFGSEETLVAQLADNIRKCIADGTWAAGHVLPTLERMAQEMGTSLKVPRSAVARLKEEGLLSARRGAGVVVLGQDRTSYRGRVLLVHGGTFLCYHVSAFYGRVTELLMARRYRVEQLLVPFSNRAKSGYDLRDLDRNLKAGYDFVVVMGFVQSILDRVVASGLPFLIAYGPLDRPKGCVASFIDAGGPVFDEVVRDCLVKGVRTVLQVDFPACGGFLEGPLRTAGLRVERLTVRPEHENRRLDDFWRAAYGGLLARLADRSRPRPDLIAFADDYLAEGGLWALAKAGLSAPRDVKVVTLANRDLPLAYESELAKIEYDPFAMGERAVRVMMAFLREGKSGGVIPSPVRYVRGETL